MVIKLGGIPRWGKILAKGDEWPLLNKAFPWSILPRVNFVLPSVQVDRTEIDEEIDHILDEPSGLFVVNNSGWSHTEAITVQNKTTLLQYLIWDEVINKRKYHVTAMQRGMERVDFLQLVTTYPHVTKPLLVYTQCDKIA